MHAVKGYCIGQTFALAKLNDSGGRKSRVRRSKDERKAMVESFIKRYQKVNNGNFPSLNLTHKEVGGSYYTVREIFREIIQDNRVLGPSKLNSEEKRSADLFAEQYPLGSISTDPPSTLLVISDETNNTPKNHRATSEAKIIVSEGDQEHQNVGAPDSNRIQVDDDKGRDQLTSLPSVAIEDIEDLMECEGNQEHLTIDKGHFVNGVQVDVESSTSNNPINTKVQLSEASEVNKDVREYVENSSEVTQMTENAVVETFLPKAVAKSADGLDSRFSGPSDGSVLKATFGDEEIKVMEEDAKGAGNPTGLVLEKDSGLPKKAVDNIVDPFLDDSVSTRTKQGIYDSQDADVEVKGLQNDVVQESSNQRQTSAATKVLNNLQVQAIEHSDTVGSHVKKHKSRYAETSGRRLTTEVVDAVKIKDDEAMCNNSHKRESSQTLDRIKIRSWDGAAKDSEKDETNPICTLFQVVVDAIVKFVIG